MSKTTRNTDEDWKRVAEENPYWGVLSHEEYRSDIMTEEAFEQFMTSGESFVTNLFSLIHKHLSPEFLPNRVLDFGCGVGRLVIPLAKRAKEAIGIDIAPAMLELCQKNAKKAGVSNIVLTESDDALSRVQGEFDLVNSYIVLQHIPPERGYKFIQTMIDRLTIGGIGSLQLTYAKSRKFFIHEQVKAEYYRRDGNTIVDLVDSGWSPPEGTITMYDYDLNYVLALISKVAGHPVITLPTNDDSHLGLHIVFVKARG